MKKLILLMILILTITINQPMYAQDNYKVVGEKTVVINNGKNEVVETKYQVFKVIRYAIDFTIVLSAIIAMIGIIKNKKILILGSCFITFIQILISLFLFFNHIPMPLYSSIFIFLIYIILYIIAVKNKLK